jgi:formylglycine-generating enzyme required for sulfatase activity
MRQHAVPFGARVAAVACVSLVIAAFTPAVQGATLRLVTKCPPDAVLVGQTCVDRYEASVWQIPSSSTGLIAKVKKGKATIAALTAGGAMEISASAGCPSASFPSTFPASGQWTQPLYAVSIPGVQPTACITWFQADQACALSGKRLLTNAEWQRAAAGTPDPGTDNGTTNCRINSGLTAVNTGSRLNCKSSWGAFDMVGNVQEWVADWVPQSTACPGWGGGFSDDDMCFAGAETTLAIGPGALIRGGSFASGANAGVFAVDGGGAPSLSFGGLGGGGGPALGFRCER